MLRLPGSPRTRNRARHDLTAEQIGVYVDEHEWRVTGGENPHRVTVLDGVYSCDCDAAMQGQIEYCSHKLAVMLILEPDRLTFPATNPKKKRGAILRKRWYAKQTKAGTLRPSAPVTRRVFDPND